MPPPPSSELYADLYPAITFSLLSPVLEETTPHLDQLTSPQFRPGSPPLPLVACVTDDQDDGRERGPEEEREREDFAKIFAAFSFAPRPSSTARGRSSRAIVSDLSPTMKGAATFETTTTDSGVVGSESTRSAHADDCRKWIENCDRARREAEAIGEDVKVDVVVKRLEPVLDARRDPHPIYSKRRTSSSTSPRIATAGQQHPEPSSSSSSASSSSSRPQSLVISSGYTSPYSSLASTPETSPTSSAFKRPSSIRSSSSSSRFSSLSSKVKSKFHTTTATTPTTSSSSSDSGRAAVVDNESQTSTPTTTTTTTRSRRPSKTLFSRDLAALSSSPSSPPRPPLPTLAQWVPVSAPIPAGVDLSTTTAGKLLRQHAAAATDDDNKKNPPKSNAKPKRRRRRDSITAHWKEEDQKRELNERLEAAYELLERECARKSVDLVGH
ncbi:hypothetical protein JCM11491_005026 [Sporobolomyces phaffii]